MHRRTLPNVQHPLAPCPPAPSGIGAKPRLRFFSMAGGDGGGAGSGGDGGQGGTDGAGAGSDGGADGGQQSTNNADGGDGFKSEHSKNSVLADLVAERKARAELQQKLDAIEDKNKTDEQRKADADAKKDAEHRSATLKAAQYEAAAAAGLSLEWAKRISGTTPEEMAADAKQLKAAMDAQAGTQQRTDGAGAGAGSSTASTAAPGVGRLNDYYAATAKK
ncbi:hypothetical protein [Gordonia malaquae]|uniref:hypothetical protein n=1 Tax=Gordonia malaquae TaxID=410332 RepID=UPI003019A61C